MFKEKESNICLVNFLIIFPDAIYCFSCIFFKPGFAIKRSIYPKTMELSIIWMSQHSFSMPSTKPKLTFKFFSIFPIIKTTTVDFSLLKLAFILAILKLKSSFSIPHAIYKKPSVHFMLLWYFFITKAMTKIIFPISFILISSFCSINASTVFSTVSPLSSIPITIFPDHTSISLYFIIFKITFIYSTTI